MLRELQVVASALGVTLQPVAVRGAEDFESAFAAFTTAHAAALVVFQDHLFTSQRARIVDFAAQSRLPAVYMYREWADPEGLMAYGLDLRDVYSRVATLVDKILKEAKLSATPVSEQPRGELPPTDAPTGTAHATLHIARAGPRVPRGLWSDRLALPSSTPPSLSPRVPSGDDATIPDLVGDH